MGKQVTNLVWLAVGVALVIGGGYCLHETADDGRMRLQSFLAERPAETARGSSGVEDPDLAASKLKVIGVLGPRETAGGPGSGASALGDGAPASASASVSLVDRVGGGDWGKPNHFLHRRLAVKTSQVFELEIPAHTAHPQLEGTFRTPGAGRVEGRGASVEVLLMSEDEFAHLARNEPGTSTYSANPSTHGDIDWDLKPTFGSSRKCYLVFRNSSWQSGPVAVDADFTLKFG